MGLAQERDIAMAEVHQMIHGLSAFRPIDTAHEGKIAVGHQLARKDDALRHIRCVQFGAGECRQGAV